MVWHLRVPVLKVNCFLQPPGSKCKECSSTLYYLISLLWISKQNKWKQQHLPACLCVWLHDFTLSQSPRHPALWWLQGSEDLLAARHLWGQAGRLRGWAHTQTHGPGLQLLQEPAAQAENFTPGSIWAQILHVWWMHQICAHSCTRSQNVEW